MMSRSQRLASHAVYLGSVVVSSLAFGFCEFAMPAIREEAAARPGSTKLYLKHESAILCRAALSLVDRDLIKRLPLGQALSSKTLALLDAVEARLDAFEEATHGELEQFDAPESNESTPVCPAVPYMGSPEAGSDSGETLFGYAACYEKDDDLGPAAEDSEVVGLDLSGLSPSVSSSVSPSAPEEEDDDAKGSQYYSID